MNSVSTLFMSLFCLVYAENWTRYLQLDENYEVRWSIEGDWITFQIEVATRGWVGFGISPNGGMTGSDVVIGWVNNGRATFHDRHAEGRFQPQIDDHQDWEFIWSYENDTHTTLRFKRLLVTCDDHDFQITDETSRLIYAYHSDDPSSFDKVMYHGTRRRGSRSILLKKYDTDKFPKSYENSDDVQHWEIRSPNVLLPDDKDTQYYCTLIKRPNLEKIHHVIEVSPLIQNGNEKFIHHIVLYECAVDDVKVIPFLKKEYHECYDRDGVPTFLFCLTPAAGWAVGGGNYRYPENVGSPIGMSDIVWYLLEVHYDNPGLEQGIFDSSGLMVTYTPKLRQHDSSTLTIGTLWFPCTFVPPRQKEFTVSGHGHSSCLRQRIPLEGIKVFSVLLHSHIIGKKIVVRHFRGDKELPPISRDRYYDFNYQEYRSLHEEHTILPNDNLIVECTYDSSERSKPTYGGFSTKEEMCVAFLGYYPKVNISGAISCPSPANVLKAVGVKQLSDDDRFVISPISGRNESYYDFLNSYSWDEISVKKVQRAMKYSPHINFCFDRGGKGILNPILSRYPRVKYYYKESNNCDRRSQKPINTSRPKSTHYPSSARPTTRKPQKGFPPRRTTQSEITRKPASGFPSNRPTRKSQNVFPPRRTTAQSEITRKPANRLPSNRPTRKIAGVTDKPTNKYVPHVLPYPFIDQIIANFT